MFPVIPQLLDVISPYAPFEPIVRTISKELMSNPIALLVSSVTLILTAIGTWLAAVFKK